MRPGACLPHALALRRASECALRARSSELMIEKKKPLKAQLAGELAAAADDAERTSIRAEFEAREVRPAHSRAAFCPFCSNTHPVPTAHSGHEIDHTLGSCRWCARTALTAFAAAPAYTRSLPPTGSYRQLQYDAPALPLALALPALTPPTPSLLQTSSRSEESPA